MGSAAATMARAYANGGDVPGKGKGDKVRALLDPREVVLPPDTVKAIGLTTIKALIAATHKKVKTVGRGRVRRMADGGLVGEDPDKKPDDTPSYGQQMANVAGAIGSGVARVAKEVVSATPDAGSPAGYGLNRLGSPSVPVASPAPVGAARALTAGVQPSDAGAGRGSVQPPLATATGDARPDLAAVPNLGGSTGLAVTGAPGVRKFVQGGNTLYSNVAGSDNDTLMSGSPGVQTIPAQPSAVAALASPAPVATAAPASSSFIPGVNAPLTQYEQETAARNAGVVSTLGGAISGREAARLANARETSQIAAAAQLAGHQLSAGASKYSADTTAGTAAARLAAESPEIQARTADLGAQAATRQQVNAAQQAFANAKTDGDRQAAEEKLRALGVGRDRNYPELSTTHVVPPKVNFDGSKEPGYVVTTDRRSGQVSITKLADQQAAAPLPPKEKLVKGQVYQTPRGAAVWDGSKFTAQ